jgi:hypothetical protein
MTEYISQADYRRQKTALTRAINSRVPIQVLATVEKTLSQWDGKAWPDAWSRWSVALTDAWSQYTRGENTDAAVEARFRVAYEQFA